MQVVIQDANQIWRSPDGSRKIYEVTYTNDAGTLLKRKTYSDKLGAGKGQSFDVQEYQKEGRNGIETFVKQTPKEDNGYSSGPSNNSGAAVSHSGGGGEKQFKGDPDTRASIERQTTLKAAVDAVAAYYSVVGIREGDDLNLQVFLNDVKEAAQQLSEVATGVPQKVSQVFPGATVEDNDVPFEQGQPPYQESIV